MHRRRSLILLPFKSRAVIIENFFAIDNFSTWCACRLDPSTNWFLFISKVRWCKVGKFSLLSKLQQKSMSNIQIPFPVPWISMNTQINSYLVLPKFEEFLVKNDDSLSSKSARNLFISSSILFISRSNLSRIESNSVSSTEKSFFFTGMLCLSAIFAQEGTTRTTTATCVVYSSQNETLLQADLGGVQCFDYICRNFKVTFCLTWNVKAYIIFTTIIRFEPFISS